MLKNLPPAVTVITVPSGLLAGDPAETETSWAWIGFNTAITA